MVNRGADGSWRQDGPRQETPAPLVLGKDSARTQKKRSVTKAKHSEEPVNDEEVHVGDTSETERKRTAGADRNEKSERRTKNKRQDDEDGEDSDGRVVVYKSAAKIFHELTPEQSKKTNFTVGIFFDETRVVCHLRDGTFTTTPELQKFIGKYGVSFIRDSVVQWLAPWAELLMNSIHLAPITEDVKKTVMDTLPGTALYFELYSLKAEVFGVMVASFLEMKDAHSKILSKAEPRAFSVNVGLLTCEKKQILRENSLNVGCTLTIMTMAEHELPEYRTKVVGVTPIKDAPLAPVKQEEPLRPIKVENDRQPDGNGRGGHPGRGAGAGRGAGSGGWGQRREVPARRSLQQAQAYYGGGPCAYCGGFGHKKKDCTATESSIQCYRCGGYGHAAATCASKA